jgi:uncharacterized protein YhaN
LIVQTLKVERFGHFADLQLPLRSEPPYFSLVYGDNEAGKTTLLEAVRSLLFGFEQRTPYNFRYEYSELAVAAALRLAGGETAEIRRLKRRKDSVDGETAGAQAVDEEWLDAALGSPSRELFEGVFGFSLERLEAGADALRDAGIDDVLYGVGLGGALSATELRDELASQAEALYTAAARTKPINVLISEIRDKRKERDEALLRPKDYRESVEHRDRIRARLEEVTAARQDAHRRRTLLARVERALPIRAESSAIADRIQEIPVPAALPDDAAERLEALQRDRDRLQAQLPQREAKVTRAGQALEEVSADRRLAPLAGEIKRLYQRVEMVAGARQDLPKRTSELASLRETVLAELRDLRPGWDLERLQQLRQDRETRGQLHRLVDRQDELRQAIAERARREDELRAAVETDRRELSELGQPGDVTELEALQTEWSGHTDRLRSLEELRGQIDDARAGIEWARGKLDPPCPASIEEPEALPVPTTDQVEEFAETHRTHEAAVGEASKELARASEARAAAQAALAGRELEGVPGDDDLARARAARDGRWKAIRRAWVDGEPPPHDPAAMAGDFEASLHGTDELADKMRSAADLVAEREARERELRAATEAEMAASKRIEDLGRERAAIDRRWTELWQPCGFEPLPPRHMAGWLATHEELRRECRELDALQPRAARQEERVVSFRERLRAQLGSDDRSEQALMLEANALLKSERDAETRRGTLRERIEGTEAELEALRAELPRLTRQLEEAEAEWRHRLTSAGLEPELDPAIAKELLRDLAELRIRLEEGPELQRRIDRMTEAIDTFEADAETLVADAAPELKDLTPEATAERLHELLSEEEASLRLHAERTSTLNAAEEELREAKEDLRETQAQIQALVDAAEADNVEGLKAALEDRDRRRELEDRLETLKLEFERARRDGPIEPFDEAIEGGSLDLVRQEMATLDEEAEGLDRERDGLNQQLALAAQAVEEIDGTSRAAELEAEIEAKTADLRDLAQRWAVYRVAHNVLHEEIQRFGRENQPEVVGLASDLFRTMTAGRYEGIRVRLGRQEFQALRPDAEPLTPDELSTGTRQQLHLALRLGYVRHYCRNREPLPLIMDDVLVNFDDDRAASTLRALRDSAESHQVLFFTCHEHLVEIARSVFPELDLHRLPGV